MRNITSQMGDRSGGMSVGRDDECGGVRGAAGWFGGGQGWGGNRVYSDHVQT